MRYPIIVAFVLALSWTALGNIASCPTNDVISDPKEFVWESRIDDAGNPYYLGTMEVGVATFDIGGETITTRAYRQAGSAYSIPGPTLKMVPGNKYVLRFHNTLPFEPLSAETNVFKDPNVSNIHTHGVHISGETPSDDVTRAFEGQFGGDFVYEIPADHMGGTYWYHAHHHGSTFLQVSGGLFGLIIIDDGNDGLPANVAAMTERPLVMGFLDPAVAGTGGDTLITGTLSPTWTVNGKVNGNLCMPPDTWQHFRILLADRVSKEKTIQIGSGCDVALLARDGVWRTEAPLDLASNSVTITGASRADLAVRCGSDSDITIDGTQVASIFVDGDSDGGPHPYDTDGSTWSASRPDYLRDLLNETPTNFQKISMGARTINGRKFDHYNANFDLAAGHIQEWNIKGAQQHPFHLHIYHLQMVNNCGNYEQGEYYDVVATNCDVRFDLSSDPDSGAYAYGGRTIMHCHILKHEDQGAMGWADVIGGAPPPTFPVDSTIAVPFSTYYALGPVDPPTIPNDPSGLEAAVASSSQIDLSWTDNSSDEDGFKIERSTDGINFAETGSGVGANVTTFSDTGLAPSTIYYYRVLAYNVAGNSGYSNVANETTDDPPVGGTSVEVGSITLSTVNQGRGFKSGRAIVVVIDDQGNLIEGATVYGEFVGDFVEAKSGVTDDGGNITFDTTESLKGSFSFGFCVTSIMHPTLEDFVGPDVCQQ